jgi:pimeloyl-ACP methyl ester carboxylesterase
MLVGVIKWGAEMEFASENVANGVRERRFYLEVAGERVPGVIWTPAAKESARDRPLVLFGHGGRVHKTIPYLVERAHRYAATFEYTVVAIDAPNHGERPVSERAARTNAELAERTREGKPFGDVIGRHMAELAVQVVPEWRATLDAVQALPEIGSGGRVGYWGLSMGCMFGLPLLAAEPRIHAAVLGLAGLPSADHPIAEAAARVRIPVEFVLQWQDEIVSRESGIALFNAIASSEKSLHINPGKHVEVPAYERASWERFYQRHLLDVPISAESSAARAT